MYRSRSEKTRDYRRSSNFTCNDSEFNPRRFGIEFKLHGLSLVDRKHKLHKTARQQKKRICVTAVTDLIKEKEAEQERFNTELIIRQKLELLFSQQEEEREANSPVDEHNDLDDYDEDDVDLSYLFNKPTHQIASTKKLGLM